ncbi:hypothetical protein Pcinc_036961, partial [Petrolisthes cinctipes]
FINYHPPPPHTHILNNPSIYLTLLNTPHMFPSSLTFDNLPCPAFLRSAIRQESRVTVFVINPTSNLFITPFLTPTRNDDCQFHRQRRVTPADLQSTQTEG